MYYFSNDSDVLINPPQYDVVWNLYVRNLLNHSQAIERATNGYINVTSTYMCMLFWEYQKERKKSSLWHVNGDVFVPRLFCTRCASIQAKKLPVHEIAK